MQIFIGTWKIVPISKGYAGVGLAAMDEGITVLLKMGGPELRARQSVLFVSFIYILFLKHLCVWMDNF